MSDQLKELHFLATRLQFMAADGHGYFAQNDIARMIRTADVMFAADARVAALEEENAKLRAALIEASTRMKNARSAVESNQVADKDVHGTLTRGMFEIAEALEASR